MLLMIEGLESQLRDQFLKQNDQLKRITQLSKIEEKETMILERLDRLEQRLIAGGINNNMQPKPKIYHGYDIIYNYNIR
jgi:hypothetical protein